MHKKNLLKMAGLAAGLIAITGLSATGLQVAAKESVPFRTQGEPGDQGDFGNQGGLGGQQGEVGGQAEFGGQVQMGGSSAESPAEIVTSTVTNTASSLAADESSAITYVMSDSNAQIKIEEAGTYIVTGSCSDGNITVKKGTTGVVLILRDLDLTSTTGATVSCNKNTEVKLIIEGSVTLTDAEDPADEESADADVADAFDGAAIKAKDGSNVYLTGDGVLNINATSCKNGIKVGDADMPSFVIDGDLTVDIAAANDGINAGYDLTILSGNIRIYAGDDGIHADRILTIGTDGSGPYVSILDSNEGLEGTVVNIFGGTVQVNSDDDSINAANSDGTYSSEMEFSINITGGACTVNAGGDGLDSNGNLNITGGYTTIHSASGGGEAGIDCDGSYYIAEGTLENYSGISSMGMMGETPAQPGQTGILQPGQIMQGETMQGGMMPGQMMPGETQPGEMQPSQTMPGEMQPGQMMPSEMQPGQMMPSEMQPGEMQPGQMMPGEMQPGQMQPGEMQPGQMQPGQMMRNEMQPGEMQPGQMQPGQMMQDRMFQQNGRTGNRSRK